MSSGAVVFGRYELHEQIGSGGSGVVWRATDRLLHQSVALKRVSFAGLDDEQVELTRNRALREARLAAQLRGHPHVVALYDTLVDDGDIWLIMEYLPSRSLRELLRTHGRLDPVRVARIGAAIADALAAGHDHGIEHRDVKPGNILIGADGTVKLTDFGISHLTGDPHLTHTGITGTPAYLAPEVAGKGESSSASDIFSLGSTLYAAVEGQPPFGTDDNAFRLLNLVRNGIIRTPIHAGPLEPLLHRLLQLDPTTRPDAATTRSLLTKLASWPPEPGPQPKARWWPPSRRTAVTTVAVGAVAVLAATAWSIGLSPLNGNPGPLNSDPGDVPAPTTAVSQPPAPIDPGIQKLRDADPCALIDPAALAPFGPAEPAIPPFLESCQVSLTSDGQKTDIRVIFREPQPVSKLGARNRQVGNVTIYRKGEYSLGKASCQYFLGAPDQLVVEILAVFRNEPVITDVCAVADVAAGTAATKLAENGVTYISNRTEDRALASSDACTLLDNTALARVPGMNQNDRKPGYANWSCNWGGEPSVDLAFTLQDSVVHTLGEATTVAGKDAYLKRGEDGCKAFVVYRPATDDGVTDMFEVAVEAPLPPDQLCDLATELAATAVGRLP